MDGDTSRRGGGAGGDAGTSTGARTGRRSAGGTQEVPDFATVKEGVGDLMKRFKKLQNAKDDYQDACAKLAERTNTNARNLNKLVKSSFKGTFDDARRDIDQQSAMFEIVGKVPGGPEKQDDSDEK